MNTDRCKPVLLFDMYGVLLKESKGNFIPYILQAFPEKEHPRLIRMIREEGLFTKAGNGELASNTFLSLLGFSSPSSAMKDYLDNYLTMDEEFYPFAEQYTKYFTFSLLSNDVLEWNQHIMEQYRLSPYFSHTFISGALHCRKPERKIYEIALSGLHTRPENILFIDNSAKNCIAADELGIRTVLFNRDHEDFNGTIVYSFQELSDLLQKNNLRIV